MKKYFTKRFGRRALLAWVVYEVAGALLVYTGLGATLYNLM